MSTKRVLQRKSGFKPAEINAEKKVKNSDNEVKVPEDEEVNKANCSTHYGNDKLHQLAADK